jgi:uncharacterized protein (DUF983 family)
MSASADAPPPPFPASRPPLSGAVLRGLRQRCPNCGQGRLFRAYLRQVTACATCAEPYGHLHADDGPAWLTILLVGHLVLPAALLVEGRTDWPLWLAMSLWPALAMVLTLTLLPTAKAAFLAILWVTGAPDSGRGSPSGPGDPS